MYLRDKEHDEAAHTMFEFGLRSSRKVTTELGDLCLHKQATGFCKGDVL
jgi:hypothetical protein